MQTNSSTQCGENEKSGDYEGPSSVIISGVVAIHGLDRMKPWERDEILRACGEHALGQTDKAVARLEAVVAKQAERGSPST